MKLLILVLGSYDKISKDLIEKGIKQTWGKDDSDYIKIMYYYGGNDVNEIKGNEILLNCSDSPGLYMTQKTLKAFKLIYDELDFDILFRTNISSYVRTKLMYNILSKYEPKDLFGSSVPGASKIFTGIGMVLSKDVIGKILENKNIENPYVDLEDDAINHILKHIYKDEYYKKFKTFDRADILENNLNRLDDNFFKITYGDKFFFRCKTIENRNMDIQKMIKLHKIFKPLFICPDIIYNYCSLLGEHIFKLAKLNDVQTIVDIGTWNGMGTTKCIFDAILGTKKQVWSLECNRIFHEQAKTNLNAILLPPNFRLILGSIVTVEELQQFTGTLPSPEYERWLTEDIGWVRNCPNVLDQLPEKIDMCVMDGGEMSGWLEFTKLWKRCKYILLNDTNALKHSQTRIFILSNSDKFKVIDDNINDKGYLVCEVLKID